MDWDDVKSSFGKADWDRIQEGGYRGFFEKDHPYLPVTIAEGETLETYALLGLQLDLTVGDPMLFDLGQAAWTVPQGWTKERVAQPRYGFRLLDEHGVAMIEGVLDVRPEVGKVAMALTEAGWQTVRERWAQLSFWGRRKINRSGGPGQGIDLKVR